MGGKPRYTGVRPPRDLNKYTDKAGALAFLRARLRHAEQAEEGTLFKYSLTEWYWHPSWWREEK